jgi:hypothetical protein
LAAADTAPSLTGAAGQPAPAISTEVAAVPEPALPSAPAEEELALPPEEEYAPETGAPIEAVEVDEPTEPPTTEEGSR